MSISTPFPRVRFDFSTASVAHGWKINGANFARASFDVQIAMERKKGRSQSTVWYRSQSRMRRSTLSVNPYISFSLFVTVIFFFFIKQNKNNANPEKPDSTLLSVSKCQPRDPPLTFEDGGIRTGCDEKNDLIDIPSYSHRTQPVGRLHFFFFSFTTE